MRYHIHTYGCQMNYSDTERIASYLNQLGFTPTTQEDKADLIIFNSCSVRQKAEDRVLGSMKKLIKTKRKRPNLLIALTGCMIRKSSTKASKREDQDKYVKTLKPLDIAFRIEDLPKLDQLLTEVRPHISTNKANFSPERNLTPAPKNCKTAHKTAHEPAHKTLTDYFHISPSRTSKTQVFIPISTGCDKFCTYCIVPHARGREISRHPDDILNEATQAVENGCLEITLLGQTVDSYGLSPLDRQRKLFDYTRIDNDEEPPPFVQLLTKINALKSKGLRRIRFTSPHPKDVSPNLINAYAELKTLMPHIHLPIQSGDNNCLQRMNRPYTRERYLEIIQALRHARPDIAITTDIIVGFCGETEKEFQNTLDLYRQVEFDFCYLAQYSPRKGTFAAENLKDNIPNKVKAEKWHRLNDLMREITRKKLENYIGKTTEVLIEEQDQTTDQATSIYRGKSEHFKTVQFSAPTKPNLVGTLQKVLINRAENWILFGDLT